MKSLEAINYSLRPNKNVERKLILELFSLTNDEFPTKTYRYVGLGSMWFVDFILFHKKAGISDMYSLEKKQGRRKRVKFNNPYKCIKLKMGMSTDVLPKMNYDRPWILWLDYDGALREDVFTDVQIFCERAKSASFLILTCNSDFHQLQKYRDEERDEFMPYHEVYRNIATKFSPIDVAERLSPTSFEDIIVESLSSCVNSTLGSTRPEFGFRRIFYYRYADNADMTTVGFFIGNDEDLDKLDGLKLHEQGAHFDGTKAFDIELPNLTYREKIELDRMLPEDDVPDVNSLPFELHETEIESYWKFYKYYPVFGEMEP